MTKKAVTVVDPGRLSDIVSANAKIAMPEVVSIFISKYETDLYNKKSELQKKLTQLKDDLSILESSAASKADFSKYEGHKLAVFDLVTFIPEGQVSCNWEEGMFEATVEMRNVPKGKKAQDKKPSSVSRFGVRVSHKMPATLLKDRSSIHEDIAEAQSALQNIISAISDMSRKERQIKARISEIRLEEEGLQGFLNDPMMQKMIAIEHIPS